MCVSLSYPSELKLTTLFSVCGITFGKIKSFVDFLLSDSLSARPLEGLYNHYLPFHLAFTIHCGYTTISSKYHPKSTHIEPQQCLCAYFSIVHSQSSGRGAFQNKKWTHTHDWKDCFGLLLSLIVHELYMLLTANTFTAPFDQVPSARTQVKHTKLVPVLIWTILLFSVFKN